MNIPNNVIIERAGSRYRCRFRGFSASVFGDTPSEAFANLRTMGRHAREKRDGKIPPTIPAKALVGRDEFMEEEVQ